MFYSYFYKISFRILKNHRFYKKTGASWFYYHSHSCTTFNLCISSACLRPNLMPLVFHDVFFIMKVQVKRAFGNLGPADDIVNCGFGEAFGQKTLIRGI